MSLARWRQYLLALGSLSLRRPAKKPVVRNPLAVEALEDRTVPSVGVRTIDGSGNNVAHSDWGSAGSELIRVGPAEYGDFISTPAGDGRLGAREISNAIAAHPADDIKNERALSAFIYVWGQFIDHDLDLTTAADPKEAFNIKVPLGDPKFDNGTGTVEIPLNRSKFDTNGPIDGAHPRQQLNDITAFLDGSMVYGSDATRAAALRAPGGKLKTSAGNLLPFNTGPLPNANDTHQTADNKLFLAGDVRANENIELTLLHTLFVREHNRVAGRLAAANPRWSDDQIYQQARRYVIAEIEAITYNEFLPALLGRTLPAYRGYDATVNPGVANEFSTAAFRLGHSLLGNDVEFLDNQGEEVRDELALKDAFFNPAVVQETGIGPILKYLASDLAEELDNKVVDGVRNFLFGEPGQGGLDLASLNIQRGRDHGLADYNATRVAYGLPAVNSFADITSDTELQQKLEDVYHDVNNIDLWVGGLAEDHVPGGSLGKTFTRIVTDQFQRSRAGDRFWYERDFSGSQLYELQHTTLADVIRRNTGISNLQDNVFFFQPVITGTVFKDANRNGRQDRGELGVAGLVVQLLDESGAVVDSTKTGRDGSYRFNDDLEIGTYQVRVVRPQGVAITPKTITVDITSGKVVRVQNFALSLFNWLSGVDWNPFDQPPP